jgi:putative chromate ion transporter
MTQLESGAVAGSAAAPAAVSFRQAFAFWFKLGWIGFGGPAGQIAIMHQELVENRHWISERRFLHALNYCMLLPGPEAQQLATYIGWLLHRVAGGVAAGVLFVLPSLLILIVLSWVYIAHGDQPLVAGLFYGIKPAVTAIVLQAAHRIGLRALRNNLLLAIAVASFVAIFALDAPFPLIVAAAALIGHVGGRLAPERFGVAGGHAEVGKSFGPALIDDETPTPSHAAFRWSRLTTVVLVGALLWLVPMALLTLLYGWTHTLTQMGWFFTKAALLTFGGAYAVLPYVYQGAVLHHGWLTPTQMIDGLALGETTPGTADHGGCLRRLHRRLCAGALRTRRGVFSGRGSGGSGHLVHLPAVLRFHPGRRPAGRIDARRPQVHRPVDGDHRCRRRGDPEPGPVLRLPRTVAAWLRRTVRRDIGADRDRRAGCAVPLSGEGHPPDCSQRARRPDRESLSSLSEG